MHSKPIGMALAAALLFAVIDAVMFGAPLYRSLLDPFSSTGSFETAKDRFRKFSSDAHRDVLVVGDSRIYSALDPSVANRAAPGLRFLNAGVPGTTPRCWYVFLRAIDPHAVRFRAIVIPVDTYADDDSAIGSIDGDERVADLHFVVLSTNLGELARIADSFSDPRTKLNAALDLLLRGPIMRDDVQAFGSDPMQRFDDIAKGATEDLYDPQAAHPRSASLAGLRVNFATGRIDFPAGVSAAERREIVRQVLPKAYPSPSYARYRKQWFTPIVARYAAAGVPVIFVRIPTRPVHRRTPLFPEGSLLELAHSGARFIGAPAYVALEQPALFVDHDHLNRKGSQRFSGLLATDVRGILSQPLPRAPPAAHGRPFTMPDSSVVVHVVRQIIGIGIPLQFQSYEFWIFLGIVASMFYALPRTFRRYLLLAASYYFYARWNGWYVLFLFILTVSDFTIALALARIAGRARRLLLASGVAANLIFLGTFKYANFASGTVSALIGMHQNPWFVHLVVPIGISFHTFQGISYLIDVYRGKTPAVRDPFDYALYLSFFPQLLAGPIVRAGLFFGELFHWRPPTADDVSYGLARAAFGLFKKVGIADQFASVSDSYFGSIASHPGVAPAWSALFAFSMQIYFDFSGYTDIAIGCARLFGFVFPENFNHPYLATSITDFWHRWHMTLSTWLRDYLYIPLGGNRDGTLKTLRNLMITMLLGGLWHGAQWTFVAWGGLHGLYLSFERLLGVGRAADVVPNRFTLALRVAVTFVLVEIAWVLFRAQSFTDAMTVYRALFAGGPGMWLLTGWSAVLSVALLIFAIARIAEDGRVLRNVSWHCIPPTMRAATLTALLLAIELFSWPGTAVNFIYFKF